LCYLPLPKYFPQHSARTSNHYRQTADNSKYLIPELQLTISKLFSVNITPWSEEILYAFFSLVT
jgi:hypothetical protein